MISSKSNSTERVDEEKTAGKEEDKNAIRLLSLEFRDKELQKEYEMSLR